MTNKKRNKKKERNEIHLEFLQTVKIQNKMFSYLLSLLILSWASSHFISTFQFKVKTTTTTIKCLLIKIQSPQNDNADKTNELITIQYKYVGFTRHTI